MKKDQRNHNSVKIIIETFGWCHLKDENKLSYLQILKDVYSAQNWQDYLILPKIDD